MGTTQTQGRLMAVVVLLAALLFMMSIILTDDSPAPAAPAPAPAAKPVAPLKILLPLGRAAYQTNERIDLAIVRAAPQALAAGNLNLTLTGEGGGKLAFTFPVPAAPLAGQEARWTEHLVLDGRLLAPGHYALEAAVDGTSAKAEIDVFSHVRKSTFKTVLWAGDDANGPVQQGLGEDGMGFNVFWGGYGKYTDATLRGGMDYMLCCTMSGGHQMDLRSECDWSDSYVLPGARARVARQALMDRTKSNTIGVHFYDEPGLSWWRPARTGQEVPFNLPPQDRQYKGAFGRDAPQYDQVDLADPAQLAAWMDLTRWKLSFMEAAWKYSSFGVNTVRPDYLSATQSMYGWMAYCDGYYFNIVRCLPVMCGHGGYDMWGPGYYHPALVCALGRVRDFAKPCWYMPAWDTMPSERFRAEQYASFLQGIQGLMTPPPMKTARPSTEQAAEGIVESNKVMLRLGTIFTTLPLERPPVAVLYSLSHNLRLQASMLLKEHDDAAKGNYGHVQFSQLSALNYATTLNQVPFFPVVEEDILDGTVAAGHKVVITPTLTYLPPKVIAGLEAFIAAGGAVLLSDDSTVDIKGAKKLGVAVPVLKTEPTNLADQLKESAPLIKAVAAHLKALNIPPVFTCDNPGIQAWRHAAGDVEYVFALNAALDEAFPTGWNPIKATTAKVSLAAENRPVYDAVLGGPAPEIKGKGREVTASFRFGAGQMRVWAMTARPIGGVQVAAPVVARDFTVTGDAPIRLELAATVVDAKGGLFSGSIPLQVRVIDPLGAVRYDLYRATRAGALQLALPLAANDPAGLWKVEVRELLANTQGAATFMYQPARDGGSVAGAIRRAVFFGNDRENIFRFFQTHHDVTIVKGTTPCDDAAADRLVESLKPWGIQGRIVRDADVNRPRELSPEQARSWVGIAFGRAEPGAKNSPALTGFDVRGPVILLGAPEDNALLKFALDQKFLPYTPDAKEFPGPGRGYVAWQLDATAYGEESIALIGYDAEGLSEAAGTMYEAMAGIDPLMPYEPPAASSVVPAAKPPAAPPEAQLAWRVALPDHVAAARAVGGGRVVALARDGTLAAIDGSGKIAWSVALSGGMAWALDASADGSLIAVGTGQHVLGFDARGKKLFDSALAEKDAPAVTFVAVSPDGKSVAAGAADGSLALFNSAGKRQWATDRMAPDAKAKYQAAKAEWDAGKAKREADKKAWEDGPVAAWKAEIDAWIKKPAATRGVQPAGPQGAPKFPEEPRRPDVKPVAGGVFTADSKAFVALAGGQAEIYRAADGAVAAKVPGVPGREPVRLGATDQFVVGEGERVVLFNAADGKIAKQIALPKAVVASAVPFGETFFVGTEADGAVRRLKALEGKSEDQTAWTVATPGRIVKRIAAGKDLVAVAYWGGTLKVLDAEGKVKSATVLAQDITALVWLDGKLVVGLADGSVVAFAAK